MSFNELFIINSKINSDIAILYRHATVFLQSIALCKVKHQIT